MTAITLPLTFANSFWTEDYRRGLETLFKKLEQVHNNQCLPLSVLTTIYQGVAENDEIIAFIRVRS